MDTLTPEQARERFGELTTLVGAHMRVHRLFETPEGEWRPVFDEVMRLRHYRLYPPLRPAGTDPVYRPKKKRR